MRYRAVFSLVVLFFLLATPIFATDSALQVESYLPKEAQDYVEDSTLQSLQQGGAGLSWLLKKIAQQMQNGLPTLLPTFATTIGGILIYCALSGLLPNKEHTPFFSVASRLALALPCAGASLVLWGQAREALGVLCKTMTAFAPGLTAALLVGGNQQGAMVQGSMFALVLSLLELFLWKLLVPLFSVLLVATVLGGACADTTLHRSTALLRRCFVWIFSCFFGLVALVLGYQTTIAAGADSLGARTAKWVLSSTIPVVGGALGESVRTLSGSVTLLRGTMGAVGILCVGSILLPVLVALLLQQIFYLLLGVVCDLLDAPELCSFFASMNELIRFAWSMVLGCGLLFVFLLATFAKCVPALTAG